MVNTEKLNTYVKKSGLSWAEHVRDIGGIPEDVETFAETFEDEASADTVSVLIAALSIPASDVGPVFFAPAEYDENDAEYHPAEPDNFADELQEIFAGLSAESQIRVLAKAYDMRDREREATA